MEPVLQGCRTVFLMTWDKGLELLTGIEIAIERLWLPKVGRNYTVGLFGFVPDEQIIPEGAVARFRRNIHFGVRL
jgi:hypothetical protein